MPRSEDHLRVDDIVGGLAQGAYGEVDFDVFHFCVFVVRFCKDNAFL